MSQRIAGYEETVDFLYSQLPMFQRDGASAYKKDLTNTLTLCNALGNPEHQFKSVHVAGTNGKGSSSHYLAAVLQTAGYKTGLYTSPHLKHFTERIKINGQEVNQQFVVDFVNRIRPTIHDVKPSFFEITVAMAFEYFARQQVDIAIVEVGMGGRLDSTNVIKPEVSLITNISKDHQQWLGDTLPKIAAEKAGIIKDHTPVVISQRQPEVSQVFEAIAREREAPLFFAEDNLHIDYDNQFTVHHVASDSTYQLPAGTGASYQQYNLAGVLMVIDLLQKRGFSISQQHIEDGLSRAFTLTGLRGRWQVLSEHPTVVCDVGHNVAGMQFILQQLSRYQYDRLFMVLGMVNDKDVREVLEMLPKQAQYYFCQARIPRAMDAGVLAEKAAQAGLEGEVIPDVNEAISAAKALATDRDFIFIGGSNFVVAEVDNL